MGKSQIIGALDLGTSVVRLVIAESLCGDLSDPNSLHILGFGNVPSYGLRKGEIINSIGASESIRLALLQAVEMAGVTPDFFTVGFSETGIRGRDSKGIVPIKGGRVTTSDLNKVIEAGRAIPISQDKEIIHSLPREYTVNDGVIVADPIGVEAVRLEAKVHLITGRIAALNNLSKSCAMAGVGVKEIIYNGLSSALSTTTEEERGAGVVVIDLGGGVTDLVVIRGGGVAHSRTLPVGGIQITNDIAAGLAVSVGVGEKIKCRFGSGVLPAPGGVENFELSVLGGEKGRFCSTRDLSEIVAPRVREIFQLVSDEVDNIDGGWSGISNVVITGGSAKLKDITGAAEHIFKVPCRLGVPRSLEEGRGAHCSTSEFSVALGLLRSRGVGIEPSRSLVATSVTGLLRGVRSWLGNHL